MKIFLLYLSILISCLLIIFIPTIAQEKIQKDVIPQPARLIPPDTSNKSTAQTLSDYFTASDAASEFKIDINWQITQTCFWGSVINIWLYENDNLIFTYNYPWSVWLYVWTHGVTAYRPPGRSYTYKLVIERPTCWDNPTWTDQGSTKPLQPPTNLSVTNSSNSDKYINMSWAMGSVHTNYYVIYENGVQIATTHEEYYTVSTTPGKTANWGVATGSNLYGVSTRVEQPASTAQMKRPENFTASEDTTVGYVRLNWTCTSDYATQFRIYRDNILLATIPFAQKYYLDYDAVPGQRYTYIVRSYNPTGHESVVSDSKFGRAVFLSASDGTFDGKVVVNWTDFPTNFEDELKLYRDGVRLPGVYSNQVEKQDEGVRPGKIHKYLLEVLKNNQVVLRITDHGFAPPNGSVRGFVTTQSGLGGVKNVEMRAYPTSAGLNGSLMFDGIDDYVSLPPLNLNSNTVTMSAWIKRDGIPNDWAGILCSKAKSTAAGLHILSTGELRYNWNDDVATWNWESGLIVPDNEWTFIALVVEQDKATIYMNDTFAVNAITHNIEEFDGKFEIGRDISSASRYFKGLISEVSIWNQAKSAYQIGIDKQYIMRGNETNLIAYWRFNEGAGNEVGDFAVSGNHHGTVYGNPVWTNESPKLWHYGITLTNGSYTIPRINWTEGTNFTIRPYKRGHGFKGSTFPQDSIVLPFTQDQHLYTGINFVDTTAILITGFVFLQSNPLCPLPGADILVNGNSTGEKTDSSGSYSISVPEAGIYTIGVRYFNHNFLRSDTLLNVQEPITDLNFLDTTKKKISGKVLGGCDNYLGLARINFKSLGSGCVDTTIQIDTFGLYEVILPSQLYSAQLVYIDHDDSLTIINYFSLDTVDITQSDKTHNFIYHSPPITTINELPPLGCGDFNVPILLQERAYGIRIDVDEMYDNLRCPVKSGTVTVRDYVAYDYKETVFAMDSGSFYYKLVPGYPNITGGGAHPYQKCLVLQTDFDKYRRFDTLWVFVRGHKPQEFQFSTVSPEIPLMILRDPPGDQSFSYISQATTTSVNIGFSYELEVGVGVFTSFKVGGGGDIPGVGETGAWVGGEVEANVGVRNTMEGTKEIKIKASRTLRTSDDDAIIGAEGDVYMGAALNILYAKTDIIDYDTATCSVVLDTGVVWNGNGFKTTYLYSESHIKNSVIPGLQALADILNSSDLQIRKDSAKILLNQIGVWQQVLDYNENLKNNAVPIPGFPSNISFSAGTNLQREATITSATTFTMGLNLFIDASVAMSIGAKAGEFNEAVGGVKIFAKLDIGVSAGVGYEIENTVGFELADNDASPPGDAFTVDVLGDPVYGTPVFKLLSGTSSCPWEKPTLPREGVGLSMNTYMQNNVPPDMPAYFDLYLYNLTQNNETRTYLLSLVHGSNPDGAIIRVGGSVLGDDRLPFSMPPNRTNPQRATLSVERMRGSVYDYENLQVHLFSECDDQFDTTVTFSVYFKKPCSDVRITQPRMNWIVNKNSNNSMAIVLKDYNINNLNMQQLKFEYRLQTANDWTQLFSYARTLLPNDSILYNWDMSSIPEGIYELRASTHCIADTYYTQPRLGIFDKTAPASFGNPQPSDGFLDLGEDIKIKLTENVNCATANTSNIKMRNISKDTTIAINIQCRGDELIIVPIDSTNLIYGDIMRVTISSLSDLYGNEIDQPITWQFVVNFSTSVGDERVTDIPKEFKLEQNYPNPFNPITEIRYSIPEARWVTLKIFDVLGREVALLVNEYKNPGRYNISWEAINKPSGIYFYRLSAGNYIETRKLILMR